MTDSQKWTRWEAILALLAIVFVLFIHGAVPFLMIPTLAQAVWSMGFSQSLANGSIFSIFVHDFGIPQPAAIAFGLAGAWPASLLIRLGLHPADAYSGIAALWLGLGFFSAYQIARRFGAKRMMSLLGGVVWLSMPIIWAHAGYSMLSWGIALLPFYFLAASKLFIVESESNRISFTAVALYSIVPSIAIFMDGYSFMMFASGASILLLYMVITRPDLRIPLLRIAIPTHAASFMLAYFLYSAYIGKSSFEAHSIDFFRGWALDLSYIAIPTKGVFWLSDLLGASLKRTDDLHFGDPSVWTTTFFLPTLLLGVIAWWRTRSHVKTSTSFLLIALFGIYMGLGPSLKVNSTKPQSLQLSHPRQQSALMASEYSVLPTGNAWISENLPGFKVMRASYRWSALGIFAFWLLVMIWASRSEKKYQKTWYLVLMTLTLINLPNLQQKWQGGVDGRMMFRQIDDELIPPLAQYVHPGEKVAFIPWYNDFIANYLAPRVGFRTFNIGGDKNLAAAQANWPAEMSSLGGELDIGKAQTAVTMLVDETTDVLILPYFHMLWSPHLWPCLAETTATLSEEQKESYRGVSNFPCPIDRRNTLKPFVAALRDSPYVEVIESKLFAVARLRPDFVASREASTNTTLKNVQYPITIGAAFKESPYVLRKGWHDPESNHAWSQDAARLVLPVPEDCGTKHCDAILKFTAFGASQHRHVTIVFDSAESAWQWNEQIVATSSNTIEVKVPFLDAKGVRKITISIPEAISPEAMTGSPDPRTLGISLQTIELTRQ